MNYLNSALDSMEAFLENWPFSIEYRDVGAHKAVSISSTSRLNLLISPSGLRSLGDARAFLDRLAAPSLSHTTRAIPSPTPFAGGPQELQNGMVSRLKLYKLVNR